MAMNMMTAPVPHMGTKVPQVQPSLQAVQLKKSYLSGVVRVHVLQGLDVDLYPGELSLISGPSGCGKSTLLSLLSGLLTPDSGKAFALGQDLESMSARELERFRLRNTGFVFQGFNLFPALTALEQVQLPLGYMGMKSSDTKRRAQLALDEVGLSHRAHMRPAELSGGEKQRDARVQGACLTAHVGVQTHHSAGFGRMQFKTLLLRAQLLDLGLRNFDFRSGDIGVGLRITQRLRGFVHVLQVGRTFARRRLPARERLLEGWQPRGLGLLACLSELPLRLGHGQIGARGIVGNAQQQLALLHCLAFLHRQLLDRTVNAGAELQQAALHFNLAARHGEWSGWRWCGHGLLHRQRRRIAGRWRTTRQHGGDGCRTGKPEGGRAQSLHHCVIP